MGLYSLFLGYNIEVMRFSKVTIGFGIYIVISASFMLQVWRFIINAFSVEIVKLIFFSLFLAVTTLYIIYISYKKVPLYKTALSLVTFGLAYIVIQRQPYFAEKLHVIEYGSLGYLALKDLSGIYEKTFNLDLAPPPFAFKGLAKNIMYALCFVVLICLLDEGFQKILPWRSFDLRDIVTNIISGFLGVLQYIVFRRLP